MSDQDLEFRERKRVKLHRWVYFDWKGSDCKGLAYDISTKGARILTGRSGSIELACPEIDAGERLELRFELAKTEGELILEVDVVRVTDDGFAVEFVEPEGETATTLRGLMSQVESDRRAE